MHVSASPQKFAAGAGDRVAFSRFTCGPTAPHGLHETLVRVHTWNDVKVGHDNSIQHRVSRGYLRCETATGADGVKEHI